MIHHVIRRAGLSTRPIIYLHGSGRDETDLMPLADQIAPDHPAIFLRGSLPFEDGYAFFRRNPDRSLDIADLEERLASLLIFLSMLRETRALARTPLLVGFSNGAIMAEAVLRASPRRIAGAVLMRPLSPDLSGEVFSLDGKPVLLMPATQDERRAPEDVDKTVSLLMTSGADVQIAARQGDHALGAEEANVIRSWIIDRFDA